MLVKGEIGTGKEEVARALHNAGAGSTGPFVVCHASALEDGTAEEWLHSLMSSQQGTLFLDGIDEMPISLQVRFLVVLRKRFGQRVIASTTADLRGLVAAGAFRQDLYHQLAMVEIAVPPLRERTEDIGSLAQMFLERFSKLYGRRVHSISEPAIDRLSNMSGQEIYESWRT